MKKRILSLALVVIMIAIMLSSFTMAYFTDETPVATNTLTIGDVKIEQSEWTFDFDETTDALYDGSWKTFEDGLRLYPVDHASAEDRVATGQLWNKTVYAKNVSPSQDACYIRTIIAVERIVSANEWGAAVGLGFNQESCSYNVMPIVATIGDKTYDVYVCTEKDEQPIAYGKNLASLASVYLYKDVTQEEVAAAGDLEILVVSEAIQAAGLTHAEAMEALGVIDAQTAGSHFPPAA